MIVGKGYGYGRALGAGGYGYAVTVTQVLRTFSIRLKSTVVRLVHLVSHRA